MIELFARTGENGEVCRPASSHATIGGEPLASPQQLTPKRLPDLEPRHRRHVVLQAGLRVATTWVLLVAGYYYIPPLDKHSSAGEIITLGVGLLLVTVIVLDQARRVLDAELPGVRAAEALAVVVPIFLLLFSTLYLSLSNTSAAMFSQKLDHSSALYFTITVFSTVGFGDIVPASRCGPPHRERPDDNRPRHYRCGRAPSSQRGQDGLRAGAPGSWRLKSLSSRGADPSGGLSNLTLGG